VRTEPPTGLDRFEAAYSAGVSEPAVPPVQTAMPTEAPPRAAPSEAVALHGSVLTPARALDDAYVVVDAGEIKAVEEQRPEGVRIHETNGVIAPGLIDLHGHPEFNVFAAWEPPKQFVNRYAWRDSELYQLLVRDPQNRLLDALPPKTQLRYSEIRALVGGVTAIQGTGGLATTYQDEALVRNVDKWIFGKQVGRSLIDIPDPDSDFGMDSLQSILDGIEAGEVGAFYVHLAEGRSDNERSREEFGKLVELDALTRATVVIHGTALGREELGDLRDGGAKLVWSPQSNLRLYGQTTRAADALELGLPVGLGADWLPSGSTSLLAEMKVARRSLFEQGREPRAKELVEMVTSDAATIAGLEDKLGRIGQGRPADLAVFERGEEDPYESVADADPSWVQLVMIGGNLAYGRADWMRELSAAPDHERFEPLLAWGKPMLLDTSYTAGEAGEEQPRLSELRAALIDEYPEVGPIFA
jgi:cytosine/adenosine deaminase-related metal-dependent hydrolase